MKKRIIDCLTLILVFLKIGAFSFGGGYAMIGIIQNEIVEKRKWIRQNDFFEIVKSITVEISTINNIQ